MHHTATLVASLASLGLICAIYFCNILARPGSWLKSELLGMIFLALLTGLFPMAIVGALIGLWNAFQAGLSTTTLVTSAVDLVGLAAVVATVLVFRHLVKETYRSQRHPDNVTPLSPRPAQAGGGRAPRRKAA